jgi:pyroglutamyl-peptidase
MMRVILTGFEPTWGIKRSPSGELAKLWQNGSLRVNGVDVRAMYLPQIYGESAQLVITEIQAFQPNAVLMFGATQKNDPLRLERFAINAEKTPMGDNTRIPIEDRPVVRNGPAGYESTLPVKWLIENLNACGVDSKASYHAGTHTCNSILYHILHWLATNEMPHPVVAGFVHIPFPNEFGVIEDALWSTASFQGICMASLKLVEKLAEWYTTIQKDPSV